MPELAKRLKIRLVIWVFRLTRKIHTYGHLLALRKGGRGIRKALIILPGGAQSSRIARYVLKSLRPGEEVRLDYLIDRRLYHSFSNALPPGAQMYSSDDVGWFQLPKKGFIRRVLSQSYDAVVDLHPSFNLVTAYLAYLSRAPLRVGFSSPFSRHFFNVEIDRKSSDFLERGYLSIQKLLAL
ncbi:MAG: hypothetical protein ACE5LH_03515 [Fidelibacterota bacterium]